MEIERIQKDPRTIWLSLGFLYVLSYVIHIAVERSVSLYNRFMRSFGMDTLGRSVNALQRVLDPFSQVFRYMERNLF